MDRKSRSSSRKHLKRRFEVLEQRYLLTAHFIDFNTLEASDYTDTEVLVRFNDDVQVESLELWRGVQIPGIKSGVLNA